MSGDDDGEVVASGQALETVARWLGIDSVEAALEQQGLAAEYEQARPQGLGLGAKFLPHNKALVLTSGVEHRLRRKLQQSQGSGEQRAGGGGLRAPLGQHRGTQLHKQLLSKRGRHGADGTHGSDGQRKQQQEQPQQGKEGRAEARAEEEEEEEDAEDARGAAFGGSKGGSGKGGGGGSGAKPRVFSRADLLLSGPQHKKKRRK